MGVPFLGTLNKEYPITHLLKNLHMDQEPTEQDMDKLTGSKLGEYEIAVDCDPGFVLFFLLLLLLLTYMQITSCEMPSCKNCKLKSRLPGALMEKTEEEPENHLMRVKEDSEYLT